MALLAGINYDPGTLATASCASNLAMTALDTASGHLRLTFTAPTSGKVLVRMGVTGTQTATPMIPQIMLGVLDGSTVKGRQFASAITNSAATSASTLIRREAQFVVTGLTGGNSYTWDAAYGVETVQSGTQIGWGGPNDTTLTNAYGGFQYEIWDATDCLVGILYDPASAVDVNPGWTSAAPGVAMTAFDTTNLRATFTAPSNGTVLVRMRVIQHVGAGNTPIHLGVLESTTVRGRQVAATYGNTWDTASAIGSEACFLVTGLTGGNSYSFDAAYGNDGAVSGTVPSHIKYGGPDNTTANDAFGGFAFEIWKTA